jgi:uncharacterized membrane protein
MPQVPTSRLEAFSDGVFAIAITLLVLDLPVPHVEAGELATALLDQWPAYAAYVVSFAIVGIIWINHHAVFGYVKRADRAVLFLNLHLLLWVTVIPWPTRLLADYMLAGGENERAAALVYALTMTLMGVAFGSLWLYLARRVEHAAVRSRTPRFVIGTPIYAYRSGWRWSALPLAWP